MFSKKQLKKMIITFQMILILSFQLSAQSKYDLSIKTDVVIIGLSSSFILTSLLINRDINLSQQELLSLDRNQINIFDRSAINYYSKDLSLISDVLLITSLSLPISLLLIDVDRKEFLSIGLMYFETLALTYGITSFTKNLTQRYRPYAYNPNIPLSEKLDLDTKKSFFSGHTSTAFASAVFFSSVYSEFSSDKESEKIIWIGTLTLASTIGVLRFFSGKHFPTDIITGAVVGGLIGYTIPKLHKNQTSVPMLSAGPNMISIKYSIK